MEKLKIEDFADDAIIDIDFDKMYQRCFVDVSLELPPPPIALSLGTYTYKNELHYIPFGTYGNFSCLVGASKSMKTFLKSALLAGYIGGQSTNYFPDLKGHSNKDKLILDVDTEQSLWHTQRVARRVCEMVGANYELYKPYSTREYTAKEKLQFIEYLVMEKYKNQVGLVAIDGAADVLDTVNDEMTSKKLVEDMMRWTSISNCHLSTVLHRNHGSDKPTGHLGSAIMKKAETVAFVTRDNNLTKVTPDYCRNYPFNEFYFELDENHLPRINEDNNIIL
jgi:hypothetical protein